MKQNIIFHGSNVEVAKPRILQNGFYKDFGYGFYCTNIEKQAKRWAITRKGDSIINRYNYISDEALKVLCFKQMTEEWLDFIVACRKGSSMSMTLWKDRWRMIRYGIMWRVLFQERFHGMLSGNW